jgi:hypothetical protein
MPDDFLAYEAEYHFEGDLDLDSGADAAPEPTPSSSLGFHRVRETLGGPLALWPDDRISPFFSHGEASFPVATSKLSFSK